MQTLTGPLDKHQGSNWDARYFARMKRVSWAVLLMAVFGLMSCGSRGHDRSDKLVQELTDSLALLARSADFNGFGVAIAGPDGVLYTDGFGKADVANNIAYTQRTMQPIASISKTFIGLALMKAQELGHLKLDDPISTYLPFAVINPHHPDVPITVRHLATHTSSIVDTDDYLHRAWILNDTNDLALNLAVDITPCRFSAPSTAVTMEEFLRRYLARDGAWYSDSAFMDQRPGARFEYSNIGSTVAALIVEKASGLAFDVFTQRYILGPLDMRSSTWHGETWPDTAITQLYRLRDGAYPRYRCITYPDGSMTTSSSDMARYMAELVKGYRGEGTLLSKAGYETYFHEQLTDTNFVDRATGMFTDEHNIGIFMGFSSEGYFGHTGGDPGVFSMFFVERKTGLGRYLIVNTDLEDYADHIRIWELLGRYAERMGSASAAH